MTAIIIKGVLSMINLWGMLFLCKFLINNNYLSVDAAGLGGIITVVVVPLLLFSKEIIGGLK